MLVGAVVWFAGFLAFNYRINSYRPDEKTRTDAIIALTGGKNRIAEAAQLMKRGLAGKMFISGVQKDISLKEISRIQKVDMPRKGKIELENRSTNTVENAIETGEWIRKTKSGPYGWSLQTIIFRGAWRNFGLKTRRLRLCRIRYIRKTCRRNGGRTAAAFA